MRDDEGNAVFHGRDAFTPVCTKISAELRCIVWEIRSPSYLHVKDLKIWSECSFAIEVLNHLRKWSLYMSFVDQIAELLPLFRTLVFRVSSYQTNSIARDISRSVTREGQLTSYLAIGGREWLHHRIEDEQRFESLVLYLIFWFLVFVFGQLCFSFLRLLLLSL